MHRRNTLGGFASFFFMGLIGSAFGPAIPAFRASFHLSAVDAGLVLAALGAGAASGPVLMAWLSSRMSLRSRLMMSTTGIGLGTIIVGAANSWSLTVAGAALFGLGSGCAAAVYQLLFAKGFGSRSGSMLARVNGVFGLGSMSGPLLLVLFGVSHLHAVFEVEGVLALLLGALPVTSSATSPPLPARAREAVTTDGRRVIVLFAIGFLLTAGLEQSVAGWETTYLRSTGVAAAQAVAAVALFWGSYTFTRLAGARLLEIVGHARLPGFAFALAMLLLLSAPLFGAASVLIFAFVGAAVALTYPCMVAWFADSTSGSDRTGALLVGAGNAGPMMLPLAVGAASGLAGNVSIPLACAGIAFCALSLSVVLRRYTVGAEATPPVPVPAVA